MDSGQSENKPNVLFIICDQMRADHTGYAGNAVIRTPNIDALAASGTVFSNARVNNPVCMPNRSTMMTGRMPSSHGVVFNDRSLDPGASTFVGQLRDHGWRTALLGKSHLQHGLSRETVGTPTLSPGMASPHPDGWDTIEHRERYEAGEIIDPDDFYGFGHIELTIGHGSWTGGHHYQWARDKGIPHELLYPGVEGTKKLPRVSTEWWQLYPAPYPAEAYSTEFVTERTIAFIEESAAADDPWMAWCSFPDPHHPMSPPEPWYSRLDPDDMVLPATYDADREDLPQHMLRIRQGTPHDRAYVIPFGPTPSQARAAIAATYGMIEFIDDGIGRILATLDRLGQTEDTIVVFTNDHGDMMGDHGILMKGGMHFAGVVDSPIIIRSPGRTGRHASTLAASIDLPSTILELCDVPAYEGMQGRSLVPALDDPSVAVRDSVLVEEDFPDNRFMPGKTRSVISDTHRYSRDDNGFEQLYDLVNDPDEIENLAVGDRDRAARNRMMSLLVDEMITADGQARMEPVTVNVEVSS